MARGRGVDGHTKEMIDYLQIRAGKECSVEGLGTASGLDKEHVQSRMLRLVRKGEHPIEVVKPGRSWRYIKAKGRGGPRRPYQPKESEYLKDVRAQEKTLVDVATEPEWPTEPNGKVSDYVTNAFVQPSWIMRLDSVERGLRVAYTVMGHDAFMKRLAYILVVNEVPDFDGKTQ